MAFPAETRAVAILRSREFAAILLWTPVREAK
jgi:hypothetical protein